MKTVELNQRSDEWLRWRDGGLTATDARAILGLDPQKSPYSLWCEKTGRAPRPDLSVIPAVKYGVAHEEIARSLYEMRTGDVVTPLCAEYDADNRFKASFDGIDLDGNPVEFKCPLPEGSSLADVRANGKDGEQYRKYYPQVQHQLLVSDAKVGHLVFFDQPEEGAEATLHVFEVERDEAMISEILEKGKAFLQCLEKDIAPERAAGDLFVPKGEDAVTWVNVVSELSAITPELERLEARKKELHETVKRLMGNETSASYGGLSVTVAEPKGSVDYKKALLTLLGRSLTKAEEDEFRKSAGAARWSIRLTDKVVFTEKALLEQKTEYESVRNSNSETFTAVDGLVL